MRILVIGIIICFLFQSAYAQDDSLKSIVKSVLFNKAFESVFFEYTPTGKWSLAQGNYAFIVPVAIFRNKYPKLLEELAKSWSTQGTFNTIPYLKQDDRTIFFTVNPVGEIKLLILFDEVKIEGCRANVVFHTTSFAERSDMKGCYIRAKTLLKRRRNFKNGKSMWKVRRSEIKPIACCSPLW